MPDRGRIRYTRLVRSMVISYARNIGIKCDYFI